jgi:chromosome partitioning protein
MAYVLALTSGKGGVGKSTLAFSLAGALAARYNPVVLVDEDTSIQSCLSWASAAPELLPFTVVSPDEASYTASNASVVVADTEGRPALEDMVELTQSAQLVVIPCGPSGLEVRATLKLWSALAQAGARMDKLRVVVNKAPPVGTVGQQARDALRELRVITCETVIRNYTAHQRAAELGVLVKDVKDSRAGAAWADIEALALEIGP